jgi:predicted RNase H-like nuclease (RuvC/YqgF family)
MNANDVMARIAESYAEREKMLKDIMLSSPVTVSQKKLQTYFATIRDKATKIRGLNQKVRSLECDNARLRKELDEMKREHPDESDNRPGLYL